MLIELVLIIKRTIIIALRCKKETKKITAKYHIWDVKKMRSVSHDLKLYNKE